VSRLSDAADELYRADPDTFTGRRKELAGQARAAGEAEAAKNIAALGKPTRSAWLINRLVRSDPSVPARLSDLGGRLRAGEAALDGAAIRELSAARRELVNTLVRQAMELSGELSGQPPSAAVREEVAGTFNAALADPEITAQVAAGAIVRAISWAGFGPGIGTAAPAPGSGPAAARTTGTAAGRTTGTPRATADPGLRAIAEAEQAVTRASEAASTAAATHKEQQEAIRLIEQQLAHDQRQATEAEHATAQAQQHLAAAQASLAQAQQRQAQAGQHLAVTRKSLTKARQNLTDAAAQVRQAAAAQRRASQALERLAGQPPASPAS
jgi:hypothetical protein